MSTLEANWDGFGAAAITPEVVANATRFTEALLDAKSAIPEAEPQPNGTISYTFGAGGDSGDSFIEIGRSRYSCTIVTAAGNDYLHGDVAELPSVARRIATWFK